MSDQGSGTAPQMLAGRTAVVTGASRGIGAAIARALALHGARVALVARNRERVETVAKDIGNGAFAAVCDLADSNAVQQMMREVTEAFSGAPDIIVNNAGVFDLSPVHAMSEAFFTGMIQTNLTAPFLIIRAFLGAMRERGSGDIVTIGSIADRNIMPENGAYSAAKYGLRALHEVLRLESNGTGVRTSLIAPGAVDTELWDELLNNPGSRMLPTREFMLSPDAVADAAIYVLSQPATVNIDELRLSRS